MRICSHSAAVRPRAEVSHSPGSRPRGSDWPFAGSWSARAGMLMTRQRWPSSAAKRTAEGVRLAFRGVMVGEGGDVDDTPAVAVLGGNEAAGEVVLVPAGEDDASWPAGRAPGGTDRLRPSPH